MDTERVRRRLDLAEACAARLSEIVTQPDSEVVRDATIKRFELTFDTVWKAMRGYLDLAGYSGAGPRTTLKQAFTEALIGSDGEADAWLRMLEDRNLSTHVYDEALAGRIYGMVVGGYSGMLLQMIDRLRTLDGSAADGQT